jgi:hypothetical protein
MRNFYIDCFFKIQCITIYHGQNMDCPCGVLYIERIQFKTIVVRLLNNMCELFDLRLNDNFMR